MKGAARGGRLECRPRVRGTCSGNRRRGHLLRGLEAGPAELCPGAREHLSPSLLPDLCAPYLPPPPTSRSDRVARPSPVGAGTRRPQEGGLLPRNWRETSATRGLGSPALAWMRGLCGRPPGSPPLLPTPHPTAGTSLGSALTWGGGTLWTRNHSRGGLSVLLRARLCRGPTSFIAVTPTRALGTGPVRTPAFFPRRHPAGRSLLLLQEGFLPQDLPLKFLLPGFCQIP